MLGKNDNNMAPSWLWSNEMRSSLSFLSVVLKEKVNTPKGIRTPDLQRERLTSLASRRWGHAMYPINSTGKWIELQVQQSQEI